MRGPRVRDPELLSALHLRWRECAICGNTGVLSLHHISNKPRDDLEGNLVMLCGSGTTGCHGLVESQLKSKRTWLAHYIRKNRPDTLEYLEWRFPIEGADEWLKRVLGG